MFVFIGRNKRKMVMTKSLVGRIAKERLFLLLKQYQGEMLDAFLQEDEYFPELLLPEAYRRLQ